jgi:hypothetical protein
MDLNLIRRREKRNPETRRRIRFVEKGVLLRDLFSMIEEITLACFSTPGMTAEKGVTLKS